MAEKYFDDQFDDEEVLFVFRKHPLVMRRGLVVGMVCILLGIMPVVISLLFRSSNPLGFSWFLGGLGVGALVGLFLGLPSWIGWYYSVFIVTNQRLIQITQRGLFHRSVVDMGLNQIQMVNYEVSGLQQTMLGFGTIMMQTFVGDLVIHDIHHPAHIQKKLLEILKSQGVATITNPFDATEGQPTYEQESNEA